MKKYLICLILVILFSFSVFASSISNNQFFKKSDFVSGLQETAIGETLQCSQNPDKTYYVYNTQLSTPQTSILVDCAGQPSLINKFQFDPINKVWVFQGEYKAPTQFVLSRSDRDYMFQCYFCPQGTFCSNVGQTKYINTQSYAVCTNSYNGITAWFQITCESNEKVDISTMSCIKTVCNPDWVTTSWSNCINNIQTRQVKDLNNCNTNSGKPLETQSCQSFPECYTNSDCSATKSCIDQKCTETQVNICNEGQTYCSENNIKLCQNNQLVLKESCSKGCGILQGETTPSCIKETIENDYSTIIIILSIIVLIFVVIFIVIKRK